MFELSYINIDLSMSVNYSSLMRDMDRLPTRLALLDATGKVSTPMKVALNNCIRMLWARGYVKLAIKDKISADISCSTDALYGAVPNIYVHKKSGMCTRVFTLPSDREISKSVFTKLLVSLISTQGKFSNIIFVTYTNCPYHIQEIIECINLHASADVLENVLRDTKASKGTMKLLRDWILHMHLKIEWFEAAELATDFTILEPRYRYMEGESRICKGSIMCNMLEMSAQDPVARFYGLAMGDVVQIDRVDEPLVLRMIV